MPVVLGATLAFVSPNGNSSLGRILTFTHVAHLRANDDLLSAEFLRLLSLTKYTAHETLGKAGGVVA